uniref:Secreted protein n=1 Tax=Heterorhabditis bacteriophora TaxID=37862 RepID=A0A1I7XPU2_HETBA
MVLSVVAFRRVPIESASVPRQSCLHRSTHPLATAANFKGDCAPKSANWNADCEIQMNEIKITSWHLILH